MKESILSQNLQPNAMVKKKAKRLVYHFFGPLLWAMAALLVTVSLALLASVKWQTSMPFYAHIAANLFVALLTVFVVLLILSIALFCWLRVYLQLEVLSQAKDKLGEVFHFFLRLQEKKVQKEREERLTDKLLAYQTAVEEKLARIAAVADDPVKTEQLQQLITETKQTMKETKPKTSVMSRLENAAYLIGEGAALTISLKSAYGALKEAGLITESTEAKMDKAIQDLLQKWQDAELGEKTEEKWQQLIEFTKEELKLLEDFLDRQLKKFRHIE